MSEMTTELQISRCATSVQRMPDAIRTALRQRARTEYSDFKAIFYALELGENWWVGVTGDGGNGAYEWFAWRDGQLTTSNCGYGWTEVALKDVLVKELE